jgi:glycosyltransferase involved in cell wall biosynthesis
MNIKYIVNVRIPTSRAQGYAIMKMCEEFMLHGSNIELIIPDRQNNEIEQDPFVFYGIQNRFPIKKFFTFDLLGDHVRFGWLFYWLDLLSFFLSIIVHSPIKKGDIVYTRDFTIASLFCLKHPVFLELHDIPKKTPIFTYAIKHARCLFVLNEHIKAELVELGVSPEHIYIAASGVNISEFAITVSQEESRKSLGLPQDKKIIMYTGHLYPWKGVDTVIDAVKEMKGVIFICIGGVDPELSQYKEKYGAYNHMQFLPFIPRKNIPLYLRSADVLVAPYSDKEEISAKYTSPLKLFEYMASMRPILISNLPSIRQVLDDTMCVFAQPGNKDSFRAGLEKILYDEVFAQSIAQKAFEKVGVYTWDKRAERIVSIITKYI